LKINFKIIPLCCFFFSLNFAGGCQKRDLVYSEKFDLKIDNEWTQQKAADDRLQIVEDNNLGKKVLKVTVEPQDNVFHHNRAELNLVNDSIVGLGDRIYSWRFKVPTDSIDSFTPGKWRVIGQWHDRPDKGMNWPEFDQKLGGTHPPCIAIELFQKDNKWMVGVRYGLGYGKERSSESNRKMVAAGELKINEWNSIEVHIHWSQSDDGSIEAKLNDQVITPFNGTNHLVYGKNMFNNVPCAFKLGIYRGFGFKKPDTMYYCDVKIEKTEDGALY
jgi:hypothetical protein